MTYTHLVLLHAVTALAGLVVVWRRKHRTSPRRRSN